MNKVFLQLLITLLVGIPVTIIILRLLLKKSMLFTIGVLWSINLLFIIVNTKLTTIYNEAYPQYLSLPIGAIVSIILVYVMYKIVRGPLDSALGNLEKLSEGKLNINVDGKFENRQDELGILARSIKKLSSNLNEVVMSISSGASIINDLGFQLAESSESLSSSANQQASSVEEISASMEEMVSTIENNSSNSIQTEKIAFSANEKVKIGNESAHNALKSMTQIAEKIKIVNDIAFQTNLLALNAAVEAARAGEYGKGFAVVAAEVRRLAERSKEAAKQIEEVSSKGAAISAKAGEELNEIIPLMGKTTGLIQEITSASQEQSTGANQINASIQEINGLTQQNASKAEEIASNAEELKNYSNKLMELIKYFDLSA
ncbi:MAG: hypothetical protein JXA77_16230 [Bacteroidales bacterium]|nr:hypothetical protein [Bacteroidales bacterium]MBN2818729.1 hypothetical protein [Bacteroidales bacterium]